MPRGETKKNALRQKLYELQAAAAEKTIIAAPSNAIRWPQRKKLHPKLFLAFLNKFPGLPSEFHESHGALKAEMANTNGF